jgi:hypothetical protein
MPVDYKKVVKITDQTAQSTERIGEYQKKFVALQHQLEQANCVGNYQDYFAMDIAISSFMA